MLQGCHAHIERGNKLQNLEESQVCTTCRVISVTEQEDLIRHPEPVEVLEFRRIFKNTLIFITFQAVHEITQLLEVY